MAVGRAARRGHRRPGPVARIDPAYASVFAAVTHRPRSHWPDSMAPSPEDHRRPWSMPPTTQPPGDAHESSVPDPTLGGDSSTGRGCTGRAGCRSRSRRRFGPCQSYAPAAPTSGRACPPSAPSCVERPLGRTSQTPIPATSAPRRGDGPVGRRGCDPPWCGDRTRRSTGLPRMVGQPWVGMMRPRPWSAFATWLTRPLRRFVASLRKLAKQRGGQAGPQARGQGS
jgi:hypothetical protein